MMEEEIGMFWLILLLIPVDTSQYGMWLYSLEHLRGTLSQTEMWTTDQACAGDIKSGKEKRVQYPRFLYTFYW